MPTIKPKRRSDGLEHPGQIDAETLARNADQVLANLDEFKGKTFPDRPDVITLDDGQLVEAFKDWERSGKTGKDKQAQLNYFAAWRTAIWNVEGQQEGALNTLLAALVRFEQADKQEQADQIRAHIRAEFKALVPSPAPWSHQWRLKFAKRFSQNRRLLPLWLRTMTKPPHGHTTRSTEKEESKPDNGGPLFDNHWAADD